MKAWHRWAQFLLALSLLACRSHSPQSDRAEAGRLRASFESHRAAYLEGIAAEKRLVRETLGLLNGRLTASQACQLMDRWAAVYFAPRVIHERIRFDEYRSAEVRQVHQRILQHLRQRYFLLHEYQRYAQGACEARFSGRSAMRTMPGLEEFRSRLEAQPEPVDQISGMLNSLPQ